MVRIPLSLQATPWIALVMDLMSPGSSLQMIVSCKESLHRVSNLDTHLFPVVDGYACLIHFFFHLLVAILGAYRVLGCNGSSNDDIILAALERAVEDKMDVINLSIGEPNGWPLNPVARAIGALKRFGVMVAVSQGNENTLGLFSVNYLGDSASVLSVASFINTKALLSYFTTSLEPDRRICKLSICFI